MAFLTIQGQPVATGRNGLALVQAVFAPAAAERLPRVAPPPVPYLFHRNRPKRGAVSSPVTPDCALGTSTVAQTRPTTLVESRSSSSGADRYRVRGNRDKPHLCAGFALK